MDSAAIQTRDYGQFLHAKAHSYSEYGFQPSLLPIWLYDFQRELVDWALQKGRAAIFADCGLGKTPMQLVWADQVARKTNGRVLILTPLAVGPQTVREATKFGIEARHSRDGKLGTSNIIVTNYERLHYFDPADFVGCVCDEVHAEDALPASVHRDGRSERLHRARHI
jgi:superfamily II DNA or RNA helicase